MVDDTLGVCSHFPLGLSSIRGRMIHVWHTQNAATGSRGCEEPCRSPRCRSTPQHLPFTPDHAHAHDQLNFGIAVHLTHPDPVMSCRTPHSRRSYKKEIRILSQAAAGPRRQKGKTLPFCLLLRLKRGEGQHSLRKAPSPRTTDHTVAAGNNASLIDFLSDWRACMILQTISNRTRSHACTSAEKHAYVCDLLIASGLAQCVCRSSECHYSVHI